MNKFYIVSTLIVSSVCMVSAENGSAVKPMPQKMENRATMGMQKSIPSTKLLPSQKVEGKSAMGTQGKGVTMDTKMMMPAHTQFPKTGDATVDTQVQALVDEMDAKINAIHEEYGAKIKAVLGDRVPKLPPSKVGDEGNFDGSKLGADAKEKMMKEYKEKMLQEGDRIKAMGQNGNAPEMPVGGEQGMMRNNGGRPTEQKPMEQKPPLNNFFQNMFKK